MLTIHKSYGLQMYVLHQLSDLCRKRVYCKEWAAQEITVRREWELLINVIRYAYSDLAIACTHCRHLCYL